VRCDGPAGNQLKAPVAIAAFDETALVNFQPDARVAKGCAAGTIGSAIAFDAAGFDQDRFGCVCHERAIATPTGLGNSSH
jgi:hypothetical protein